MGLVQWCTKHVRGGVEKVLWTAQCALLKEHASQLAEVYKEQSKLQASRVLRPQQVSLADGYWLACEDIAKIWGTLMGEEVLPMDHLLAYDMVLEHVLHVRMGYMTHGAIPGPGMQEDGRHHYVIVNSSRSNEEGNHWGVAVWDGTSCPEANHLFGPL